MSREIARILYFQQKALDDGAMYPFVDATAPRVDCKAMVFAPIHAGRKGAWMFFDIKSFYQTVRADADSGGILLILADKDSCTPAEIRDPRIDDSDCLASTYVALDLSHHSRVTGRLPDGQIVFDLALSGDTLVPIDESWRWPCDLDL